MNTLPTVPSRGIVGLGHGSLPPTPGALAARSWAPAARLLRCAAYPVL